MINELLSHHLFVKLLLLFILSRFLGEVFERLNKPSMIGEILAGIILGPSILGWINADQQLKVVADIAVFFLVIIAGLEINVEEIKNAIKGKNIWISFMSFFVPIISGIILGYTFTNSILSSLFLGLCISITALPVSIRLLMDIGKLNTDIGRKIVAVGATNDILALMILGILVNLTDNTEITFLNVFLLIGKVILKVVAFFIIIVFSYRLINWLLKKFPLYIIEKAIDKFVKLFKSKESIFSFILLFILIFASVSELVGLHMVVGTFFGSLLLKKEILGDKYYRVFEKSIHSVSMGFLSPIFFATIGLSINVNQMNNLLFLLLIIIVSMASKTIGGFIGGKIAGQTNFESLTLGVAVNGRGLMDIVIATIAYENHIIDAGIYSMLVIMVIVGLFFTSFLIKIPFNRLESINLKKD